MMKHRLGLAILGSFLAATLIQSAAAQEIQSGQWHMVTQGTSTAGGQQTPLPKNEIDSCVTAAAAKEAADVTRQPAGSDCKTDLLWRSGSKIKTRTTCSTSTATVDFDLSGTTYSSVTHLETTQNGAPVTMDITVTGTRTGDCPK